MANSPEKVFKSTRADKVRELARKGWRPHEIAKKLAPHDFRKQRSIRHQVYRVLQDDPQYQTDQAVFAHAVMVGGLETAAEALVRRAGRGRPDAIKLLFEASGFHNPRVKHEHSGEVAVKVTFTRPALPHLEEHVPDADVIED